MESNVETLTRLVRSAARHPDVVQNIRRHATGILTHLGMSWSDAASFIDLALRMTATSDWILATESALSDSLPLIVDRMREQRMAERGTRTFARFANLLEPGSILDLGGGSGEIGMMMMMKAGGSDVMLADIRDWRGTDARNLPFLAISNDTIPLGSKSVDTVVILMALHHSNDPKTMLSEAFRVARRDVIVIESVTNTLEEYLYGCWIDWFYNRILHFVEDADLRIPVPCNFLSATCWEQLAWKLSGLAPSVSKDLGIFQDLNPEHHWLFQWKT